ncbi:MAG: helix-turn-helix domain-containing protein, partial [Rhodospirillaceae bacterium]
LALARRRQARPCRRHRQGIYDRALAATDYGFAKAVAHAVTLGQFSASERLASFLAEMGARLGCAVAGGTEIDLPMTRDDIADYLGLTSETVSRQFRRLKDAGLIRLPTPSRLVVPDMARLAARAPALAAGGLSSGDERSIA